MRKKHGRKTVGFFCCAVLLIAALFGVYKSFSGRKPPEITVSSANNIFSVNSTDEDWLRDVSANDDKDGDVTDSLIVEGISNFTDRNTRIVTYAAFDSDNNVAKFEREISYSDYSEPKIVASRDLIFPIGVNRAQITARLSCIDVIDGDISKNIVLESELQPNRIGTQKLLFTVVNSCGDTASATLDIQITG